MFFSTLYSAAGHETTAVALTNAFHLLARHPEVQERAFKELTSLGLKPGCDDSSIPTAEMYEQGKLKYIEAIFNETLRLYPSATAVGRKVIKSFEYKGVRFDVGDTVMAVFNTIQRDTKYWGQDAGDFDPSRMLDPSRMPSQKLTLTPFGIGHRSCIGERFSRIEAALILSSLLLNYRVTLAAGMRENLDSIITAPFTLNVAEPVRIAFEKRK
jgi:cytochrome P450 family 4